MVGRDSGFREAEWDLLTLLWPSLRGVVEVIVIVIVVVIVMVVVDVDVDVLVLLFCL